ncbi:MAG TPA: hypothetical protein VFN13_10540, partial [Rudaea sp.]|nr:hypothetical protein [Rudaea sp.]
MAVSATDGYFDPTWAGSGRITFAGDLHNPDHGSVIDQVNLTADGNLLLGGTVYVPGGDEYWWLGELQPNGTLSSAFGENNASGRVTGCSLSSTLCTGNNGLKQFTLMPDGKIYVLTESTLSRVLPGAHSLDTAGVVGDQGVVALGYQINNVQGTLTSPAAIAQTVSGKWFVVGKGKYQATSTTFDTVLLRLNANLSLDTGFNAFTDGNGVVFSGGKVVNFGSPSAGLNAIARDSGDFLLAAHIDTYPGSQWFQLDTDGHFLSGFGNSGWMTAQSCPLINSRPVKADRAGRYLAVCNSGGGMQVMRFSADGHLDSTLGISGYKNVVPPTQICAGFSLGYAATLDSAGRILLAGICSSNNTFLVARLFGDDGSLDQSFGIGGYAYGS